MRLVMGFALVGACLSGIFMRWTNFPGDIHAYGAVVGLIVGLYMLLSPVQDADIRPEMSKPKPAAARVGDVE